MMVIYVAKFGDNTVSVINTYTNKVVGTLHVGKSPSSITYDSANGRVQLTNSDSNTVCNIY